MPKLSSAEADQRLKSVKGWRLEGNQITKQFTFRDFPAAVRYVNDLVPEAEAADHHPDILINYKRVTLTSGTPSAGGMTNQAGEGAAAAGRLAEAMGGA